MKFRQSYTLNGYELCIEIKNKNILFKFIEKHCLLWKLLNSFLRFILRATSNDESSIAANEQQKKNNYLYTHTHTLYSYADWKLCVKIIRFVCFCVDKLCALYSHCIIR